MTEAPDDFERLLERCRAQLGAITLSLPIIEAEGGPNALPPPPSDVPAPKSYFPPPQAAAPVAPPVAAPVESERTERPALPAASPERKPEPSLSFAREPALALPDSRTLSLDEPERAPAVSRAAAPPPAQPPRPAPPQIPTAVTEDDDVVPVEPQRRTSLDLPVAPVAEADDQPEELPRTPPAPSRPLRLEAASRSVGRASESSSASPFGWGAVGGLAVAALIGFGVWRVQRPAADRTFELDPADAAALRPEHSDILVAQGAKLLNVSETGRALESRTLEAPVASISWNAGNLWSVDGRTRAVLERRDATGTATAFTLNHVPRAVYAHGRYLWTLEDGGKTIRQYLVSRSLVGVQLQPLDMYQLPDLTADAIAVDDADVIWVFDHASRRLYRLHAVGASLRPIDSAPLKALIGAADVRAMFLDDGAVWILAAPAGGRSVVHRVTADQLDWAPN
jgi:hypothetical protein